MEKTSKIKLKLTTGDKIIELLSWVAIIVVIVITIASYTNLPDIIPIHYNGAGVADDFGKKQNILALPILAAIYFVFFTILNKFLSVFSYPNNVDKCKILRTRTLITKLIRYLKFIFVVIFGYIEFQTIRYSQGDTQGLGWRSLPLTLGVVFIPLIYFVVQLFKHQNNKKVNI